MSIHSDIYSYFENIAKYHPELLHDAQTHRTFYRSIQEAANDQRSTGSAWPALICVGYDYAYTNNPDALIKKVAFEIWVVGPLPTSDKFNGLEILFDSTMSIIDKIIGRIHEDRKTYKPGIWNNFHPERTSGEQIGPVLDSKYGHSARLMLEPPSVITYDAAEWGAYAV